MKNSFDSHLNFARQIDTNLSDSSEKNYSNYKSLYAIAQSAEHNKRSIEANRDKMRGLTGKLAAREVIRDANGAIEVYDNHNSMVAEAYAPGSEVSLKAYDEAILEDKARDNSVKA